MTNYEKNLLLVFQERLGKVRPFCTKNVTHLRKPVYPEKGIEVTYVTLQHMKQIKARCFNSDSKGYSSQFIMPVRKAIYNSLARI